MTQEHPITPPPELILEWCQGWNCSTELIALGGVATQAARWGADQELEACVEWLDQNTGRWDLTGRLDILAELRADRRPKQLSLKEQALTALDELDDNCRLEGFECPEKVDAIRRAIESLPD